MPYATGRERVKELVDMYSYSKFFKILSKLGIKSAVVFVLDEPIEMTINDAIDFFGSMYPWHEEDEDDKRKR